MKKETEILATATATIKKARLQITGNDTLWEFLFHAEQYLQESFKAEFKAEYREAEILEAETLEV